MALARYGSPLPDGTKSNVYVQRSAINGEEHLVFDFAYPQPPLHPKGKVFSLNREEARQTLLVLVKYFDKYPCRG